MRLSLMALCLLAGCAHSDPWNVSYIQTGDPAFDSGKLSYKAADAVNEIDVEILRVRGEERSYLSLHSHPVMPHSLSQNCAPVSFKIGDEIISGVAYRHEGGQKLLLPSELHELLISALKEGQSVEIQLPGYAAKLEPRHFMKNYKAIQQIPLRTPVQLPF